MKIICLISAHFMIFRVIKKYWVYLLWTSVSLHIRVISTKFEQFWNLQTLESWTGSKRKQYLKLWKMFQIWPCCHGNQNQNLAAILVLQIELCTYFPNMLGCKGVSTTDKVNYMSNFVPFFWDFGSSDESRVFPYRTSHVNVWDISLQECYFDHFS